MVMPTTQTGIKQGAEIRQTLALDNPNHQK